MTIQEIKNYIVSYAKNSVASKYYVEGLELAYNTQVSDDSITQKELVEALTKEENFVQAKPKTKHENGFYREFTVGLSDYAEIRFVVVTDFEDKIILEMTTVLKVFP